MNETEIKNVFARTEDALETFWTVFCEKAPLLIFEMNNLPPVNHPVNTPEYRSHAMDFLLTQKGHFALMTSGLQFSLGQTVPFLPNLQSSDHKFPDLTPDELRQKKEQLHAETLEKLEADAREKKYANTIATLEARRKNDQDSTKANIEAIKKEKMTKKRELDEMEMKANKSQGKAADKLALAQSAVSELDDKLKEELVRYKKFDDDHSLLIGMKERRKAAEEILDEEEQRAVKQQALKEAPLYFDALLNRSPTQLRTVSQLPSLLSGLPRSQPLRPTPEVVLPRVTQTQTVQDPRDITIKYLTRYANTNADAINALLEEIKDSPEVVKELIK